MRAAVVPGNVASLLGVACSGDSSVEPGVGAGGRFGGAGIAGRFGSSGGVGGETQSSAGGVGGQSLDETDLTGGMGGSSVDMGGTGGTGGMGGSSVDTGGTVAGAGGAGGGDGRPNAGNDDPEDGRVPAIFGAGYGGLRVLSLAEGKTWTRRAIKNPNGGDDENLIRAVGYGDGVFLGVGWKIFRSEDGKSWSEIDKGTVPGTWFDCVEYRDGQFIVKRIRAGQKPEVIVSADRGKTWRFGDKSTSCRRPGISVPGLKIWRQHKGKIFRSENDGPAQLVSQECCNIQGFVSGFVEP